MYKAEFINKLKQTNLSVDSEKTRVRAENLWKSANSELKHQIEEDTSSSRASIYRIYQTGAISAKMAIAFAQRLNSDPYYLIGETDEDNGYSEERTESFLRDKGYSKLVDTYANTDTAKVRTKRKKQQADKIDLETITAVSAEEKSGDVSETILDESEPAITGEPKTMTVTEESQSVTYTDPKPETDNILTDINEDEMSVLLNSLIIRARFNKGAREQLDMIKKLLSY